MLTRQRLQDLAQDSIKIRLESLICDQGQHGKEGEVYSPLLTSYNHLTIMARCSMQTFGHITKQHSSTWAACFPHKSALHLLSLWKLVPQELIQDPLKFMDCLQGTAADLEKRFKGSFNQLYSQGQKANGACITDYLQNLLMF